MHKFFNTAGPCQPERHYMTNPLPRLTGIRELIDGRHYFILHAPRQTGKTTYLYALMHQLNQEGKYTALTVNLKPAVGGKDTQEALQLAALAIYEQAKMYLPEAEQPLEDTPGDGFHTGLHHFLAEWAWHNPKPLVLFLDDADTWPDDSCLALLGATKK